jgi:serine O-acetyltransferase
MNEITFIQKLYQQNQYAFKGFPNKPMAEEFIDKLYHFLFTPYHDRFNSEADVENEYELLKTSFQILLKGITESAEERAEISGSFFKKLPDVCKALMKDAEALFSSDPAATSIGEVLVSYPGFFAIAIHRIAHVLCVQKVPVLPRLFSEYAHKQTGIDIHPGAQIGEAFAIDHGTGIVIGETTLIGNRVKIYQGVTLGALSVEKENAKQKRHPTIEDDVVIYSGATILGGGTVVGHSSIIGGNVWLTYSVPSYSVVYHLSEVKVRDKVPFPEPINFII